VSRDCCYDNDRFILDLDRNLVSASGRTAFIDFPRVRVDARGTGVPALVAVLVVADVRTAPDRELPVTGERPGRRRGFFGDDDRRLIAFDEHDLWLENDAVARAPGRTRRPQRTTTP